MESFAARIAELRLREYQHKFVCPSCETKNAYRVLTVGPTASLPGKSDISVEYIYMETCNACGWVYLEIDGEKGSDQDAANLMDRVFDGMIQLIRPRGEMPGALTSKVARKALSALLDRMRNAVLEHNWKIERMPAWFKTTAVRYGWVNDSLIAVFDPSREGNSFHSVGPVGADTVVLLDCPNFAPKGASLKSWKGEQGMLFLVGDPTHGPGKIIMRLTGEQPAFFDAGYSGYHGPIALYNLIMTLDPEGSEYGPKQLRYLPFALYLHETDLVNADMLWEKIREQLFKFFEDIHASQAGDIYESINVRGVPSTFSINKASGVLLLGKYAPHELKEIEHLKELLRARGYDAQLVKELPEVPFMSNEEKVRLWALASRFCIMIDREPAGHIAEYIMLREQRSVFALMRPHGIGSTYMIGDDHLADINFIQVFSFKNSPSEVLDDAIDWAESVILTRGRAYDAAYPWRQQT